MSVQEELENEIEPESSPYIRYINGAFSGLIEVSSTHWIDVIKTKLQAEKETSKIPVNAVSLSKQIWAKEGFTGFYRGYVSRMVGIGPMRAIFWGTMDTMNSVLKDDQRLGQSSKLIIAGSIGGFVQSVADVPIEVAKIKLITSSENSVSGILKEAAKFRGASATFTRNIIFAAIMNFGINYDRFSDASPLEIMFRAGISGVFASFVTQPLDYVKTQQQKFGGFHNVNFVKLLVQTGRKSLPLLWTGGVSRAILSVATMSVSGTVFKLLARLQQPQNRKRKE